MNDAYTMNQMQGAVRDGTTADGFPSDRATVQLPICHRTLSTELSGDFSLPDYQPEIKRLLRIGASVLPPERYTSGDSLELERSMDYFVLYMGNDNNLYCAPLSTDYRMSLSLSEERERIRVSGASSPLDGELTCTCDITAEPVTGRVTAPRRLNIKSRLKAAVRVMGTCSLAAEGSGELTPASIERLSDTAPTARLYRGSGEVPALQDDMILTPAEGGDVRVICAEGQVMVSEATAGQDMVTCRGEVLLKLTLCPAEPPEGEIVLPTVTTRKIPFSQAVQLAGVTPDCKCCAYGACSEMSVEVEEGHLHTDLGVMLEVMAQKNQTTAYVKDLYSTHKETNCDYTTYATHEALACFNGNFTLSDSQALNEAGISPTARVVDVSAVAFPEAVTADPDKNRCVLSGRCRVQLLLFRDGEYTASELEFPFRYEKDGIPMGSLTAGEVPEYDGSVQVMTCRARMDGERIGVDAEVAVALRLMGQNTLTALSSVAYGQDVTRRRGEYVICFPAPTDTLWSVAKRYHAPMAALGAANGLSLPESADHVSSLTGVEYLIV